MTLPQKSVARDRKRKRPSREMGGDPRFLSSSEHQIRPEQINPIVYEIVERLESRGYIAWIVGGAVRDMLLGRHPKDFDIATNARPEEVKSCFHNARIIGRRFRLALLEYPGMVVEVATFRGKPPRKTGGMIRRDNTFGTPEEDAFRRDFTINAMAFDLERFQVIDYVGGLQHLESRTIRTITPPQVSLGEDPVRMLRAVRFMVRLGFTIHPELARAIRSNAHLLALSKRHRLAEETQRFLCRGNAPEVFAALHDHGLLSPLLALTDYPWLFDAKSMDDPLAILQPYLEAMEDWNGSERPSIPPLVALTGLVFTLSKPAERALLLGISDSPEISEKELGQQTHTLQLMLAEWGILNGHVELAIQIIEAARSILHRLSQAGVESVQSPDGQPSSHLPGIREAWMLLLLLKNVVGFGDELTTTGLIAVESLPPLHIPTNPRPKAGAKNKRDHRGGGKKRSRRRYRRKPRERKPVPDPHTV